MKRKHKVEGADRKEMRICIIAENGEMEMNKNEIDGRKDRTRQLDGGENWVRGELEEQEERDMTGYSAQRAVMLATVRAPANSYMHASWFSVRATWSQRQSARTRPLPGSVEWKQSPRWIARSQNSHVDYPQQTPTHQRIRDTQRNTHSQHSLRLWAVSENIVRPNAEENIFTHLNNGASHKILLRRLQIHKVKSDTDCSQPTATLRKKTSHYEVISLNESIVHLLFEHQVGYGVWGTHPVNISFGCVGRNEELI